MQKMRYLIIFFLTLLILWSGYYVDQATHEKASQRAKVIKNLSTITSNFHRLKFELIYSNSFSSYDSQKLYAILQQMQNSNERLQRINISYMDLSSVDNEILQLAKAVDNFLLYGASIEDASLTLPSIHEQVDATFDPLKNRGFITLVTRIVNKLLVLKSSLLHEDDMRVLEKYYKQLQQFEFSDPRKERIKRRLENYVDIFLNFYVLFGNSLQTVLQSDIVTIAETVEFNYDLATKRHRENVFAYQKLMLGVLLLAIGFIVYFIYSTDREKLKLSRLKRRLEKNLVTDGLTGLGNRTALVERIRMHRHEKLLFVMFNITKFKNINDFYGIAAGDHVLKAFAGELKRLTSRCEGAELFRAGGDDFIVMIRGNDVQRALQMSRNAIEHFEREGIKYKDTLIDIRLSVGVSNTKPYLETADLALKEAKRNLNESIVMYGKELDKSHIVEKNIMAVKMLKEGIANDRFYPQFQPIVDLATNAVTKYEALIRLKKPDGNIAYPASFIEEAKESKLLNKLTKIMLVKSFEVFKHTDFNFSINLSFSEIKDEKNQDEIIKIIDDYGRHAKKLTLEILEDESIDEYKLLDRFLQKVTAMGVDIAIDDFGSGYSNFQHIISMNTHFLKIDGSLIKIIDYDIQARVLVKSIVDFAKSMRIKTVAEFVHNQDVLDMVKRLGVDYAQGFYLGKPANGLDVEVSQ